MQLRNTLKMHILTWQILSILQCVSPAPPTYVSWKMKTASRVKIKLYHKTTYLALEVPRLQKTPHTQPQVEQYLFVFWVLPFSPSSDVCSNQDSTSFSYLIQHFPPE